MSDILSFVGIEVIGFMIVVVFLFVVGRNLRFFVGSGGWRGVVEIGGWYFENYDLICCDVVVREVMKDVCSIFWRVIWYSWSGDWFVCGWKRVKRGENLGIEEKIEGFLMVCLSFDFCGFLWLNFLIRR